MKPKLTVLTGAGMSAESGIKTFRDSDGLWEEHDVMSVASLDGWKKDPRNVIRFYNERRAQLGTVQPNAGHIGLKDLEEFYDVQIITQNVDSLHERAGSTKVLHLHGELTKVCNYDKTLIQDIGYEEITYESGLRPFIVWFGEDVPLIVEAERLVRDADIIAIIGCGMQVYPAANLITKKRYGCPVYIINPKKEPVGHHINLTYIQETATKGVEILKKNLIKSVI